MALSRRAGQRGVSNSIWPGFVDAMTALLLVLMFVLSIFMLVQFVLRETIDTQDTELQDLATQIAGLSNALGLSQARVARLESTVAGLEGDLAAARVTASTQASQIAALIGERDRALERGAVLAADLAQLEAAQAVLISEQDALQMALARMRNERDAEAEAARLAAARREALEAAIAAFRTEAAARETDLAARLAGAEAALTDQDAARLADAAALAALRARLDGADAELTAMSLALDDARRRARETLSLLAAAEMARTRANAVAQTEIDERQRQAALLALAQRELALANELAAEDRRRLALLNQQVAQLSSQVASLQDLLGAVRQREAESMVQIESLGADLNLALARLAAEESRRAALEAAERIRLQAERDNLERYRSEFFGLLRDVLGGRDGIEIVGDRFVFSSEVLFELGSPDISPVGRPQIARVVELLRDIADDIPDRIDWVLRVDGHTDNLPIAPGGRFADNWELSQARALSVVRYMIDVLGFPPERLAAAGFGEYRPVDPRNTPEARARNRRIELKLTER